MYMVIRLDAGQDISGNPMRLFLLLVNGTEKKAWDDNYLGQKAIPERYRGLYMGCTIKITKCEYRRLLSELDNSED